MAKDYKNSQHPDVKRSSRPAATWVIFITGLATGLFAAAILYLHGQKSGRLPTGAADGGAPVVNLPAPDATDKATPKAEASAPVQERMPASKGKEDVTRVDVIKEDDSLVSRFGFYSILPKREVIIPEQESKSLEQRRNKPDTQQKPEVVYVLQAGSFRRLADADRLRAQLALLGVESAVKTVTIANNETWHRVRIGPNSSYREIDKLRRRMSDNNISSILFKLKPGDT